MYMTMTGETDADSLQQDLNQLATWEKKWQMKFHPQKCSVLRITRNQCPTTFPYQLHGHTLESENCSKYLGVTISSKLSWNDHINNICKKANNSLAFLRRNLQISQHKIKAAAYTALVRPQLEYAAAIWDPYTKEKKNKLEMVQRRVARYVQNNYSRESSVTEMLQQLGYRSLSQRRADIRLVLFYKSLHGFVAIDLCQDLEPQTRVSRHCHSLSFHPPAATTLYMQQSFLPRTVAQWNKLPEAVARTPSLEVFKNSIAKFIH